MTRVMPQSGGTIEYIALLGALCVAGAIVGIICGVQRSRLAWPRYLGTTAVAFGVLAAGSITSLLWMHWSEYDKELRASFALARQQGYVVRTSVRNDGTMVFMIKDYVVPDGSFTIVGNRTPFRPEWLLVAKWSLICSVAASFVSTIAEQATRRRLHMTSRLLTS